MLVVSAVLNLVMSWQEFQVWKWVFAAGIVVNNKMQTSDPSIFAIGEVALYNHMNRNGLVAPGYEMADVAAEEILGNDKLMRKRSTWSNTIEIDWC